jgi:hypothetical protein
MGTWAGNGVCHKTAQDGKRRVTRALRFLYQQNSATKFEALTLFQAKQAKHQHQRRWAYPSSQSKRVTVKLELDMKLWCL